MEKRICTLLCSGIVGLALAFSLASCGGSSPAPANDHAPQEEPSADTSSADASDPMEGLAFHENDYLTIGLADGWAVNTDVGENKHIENADRGYYSLTLQYEDASIGRRGLFVSVFDEPSYDWAIDYSGGYLPEEGEGTANVSSLDPITVDGVELHGYRSQNSGTDGSLFWFGFYNGTVNGHYVEIFFTDGSEGNVLLEDQIAMARSVHIK